MVYLKVVRQTSFELFMKGTSISKNTPLPYFLQIWQEIFHWGQMGACNINGQLGFHIFLQIMATPLPQSINVAHIYQQLFHLRCS